MNDSGIISGTAMPTWTAVLRTASQKTWSANTAAKLSGPANRDRPMRLRQFSSEIQNIAASGPMVNTAYQTTAGAANTTRPRFGSAVAAAGASEGGAATTGGGVDGAKRLRDMVSAPVVDRV